MVILETNTLENFGEPELAMIVPRGRSIHDPLLGAFLLIGRFGDVNRIIENNAVALKTLCLLEHRRDQVLFQVGRGASGTLARYSLAQ